MSILEDSEKGTEEGQTRGTDKTTRAAKSHQDFWKPKLRRRSFKARDGHTVEIPEWQVRMKHDRKEAWFNLDTANQAAAAVKARDIYLSLVSVGWEATLAKYKPSPLAKADVCTVGEFLADVKVRSHLKPITVRRYAVKLRKMVADLAKVEAGEKKKAKRAKYDYVNGGHKLWLQKVDGQPLDILTSDSVNEWRNKYVAKSGADPIARKSAERSAASYFRCVRALFSPDVLSLLKVKLPPVNPFAGVKVRDPGAQRYQSRVNAEWLLASAERELRQDHAQVYLGLFLCLWAGLRRKEADLLLWEQIDFSEGCINVCRTLFFEPKTEESQRKIDLSDSALNVLRVFKKDSTSAFVLNGAEPNPLATYDYYRCDCTWRDLNAWLKKKGVKERKAIHSLRKESGSLIASNYGIEAARQHLGHRDIRTTSSHYVDKKKRVEINIPMGPAAGQLRAAEGQA